MAAASLAAAGVSPSAVPLGVPEPAAVSCRNVTVRFVSDRRTVTALENVSFTLERGGFLSLLGPSGCGKSTFMKLTTGLKMPSRGTIQVDGKPLFLY